MNASESPWNDGFVRKIARMSAKDMLINMRDSRTPLTVWFNVAARENEPRIAKMALGLAAWQQSEKLSIHFAIGDRHRDMLFNHSHCFHECASTHVELMRFNDIALYKRVARDSGFTDLRSVAGLRYFLDFETRVGASLYQQCCLALYDAPVRRSQLGVMLKKLFVPYSNPKLIDWCTAFGVSWRDIIMVPPYAFHPQRYSVHFQLVIRRNDISLCADVCIAFLRCNLPMLVIDAIFSWLCLDSCWTELRMHTRHSIFDGVRDFARAQKVIDH